MEGTLFRVGASPSTTSSLFGSGDSYKRLHSIAVEKKPDVSLDEDQFAIAILQHDKDQFSAVATDFLWFKVKSVWPSITGSRTDENADSERNTRWLNFEVRIPRGRTSMLPSNTPTTQLRMPHKFVT